MKPFLLIATRPEDAAARGEYRAMLRYCGLTPRDVVYSQLDRSPLPRVDLDELSGVIVGGSPYSTSDPTEEKSPDQVRAESELSGLLDRVVARDFPFFGACYGVGTVGTHLGAVIDGTHREPISVIEVERTAAGAADPLLAGLPDVFTAFVGHKEAITVLPPRATLLARGAACPVQMFRVGQNVYATQFHPELDLAGISTRIRAYAHHGYFAAGELDVTLDAVRRRPVTHTGRILRAFAERYAR